MPYITRAGGVWRTRSMQILVSALAGAGIGWLVYVISQISGKTLFVVTGSIAGAFSILVFQWYARTAQLTEVKVTIPQLSELTFVVNNDSRQVAWKLFVETVTRISTQPLHDDEGILRESLTSLYGLFASTRETLKASRPSVPGAGGRTVEHFAITMLNNELRPFLAAWHPRLRAYEQAHPQAAEAAWSDSAACRADLRRLQINMHEYAKGFARLAGVSAADTMIGALQSTAPLPQQAPSS